MAHRAEHQGRQAPGCSLQAHLFPPLYQQQDAAHQQTQGQHLSAPAQQPVKGPPVPADQKAPQTEQVQHTHEAQQQQHRREYAPALGQLFRSLSGSCRGSGLFPPGGGLFRPGIALRRGLFVGGGGFCALCQLSHLRSDSEKW